MIEIRTEEPSGVVAVRAWVRHFAYGALDDAVAWAGARNGREQAGADHTGVHS